MSTQTKRTASWLVTTSMIVPVLFCTMPAYSQGYDDPFTEGINEGAIGSGYDDPFTEGINEGAIGNW